MDLQLARDVFSNVKFGAIGGLSIGFITAKDDFDEKTGVRLIKEVRLFEVSVVTFPANELALIDSIKTKYFSTIGLSVDSLKDITQETVTEMDKIENASSLNELAMALQTHITENAEGDSEPRDEDGNPISDEHSDVDEAAEDNGVHTEDEPQELETFLHSLRELKKTFGEK